MEGVYSCVSGRPCRTRDDTYLSIKVSKDNNDMAVTKAVKSHVADVQRGGLSVFIRPAQTRTPYTISVIFF